MAKTTPRYKRPPAVRPPKDAEVKYRKLMIAMIDAINKQIKREILPIVRDNRNLSITDSIEVRDGYIADVAKRLAVIKGLLRLNSDSLKMGAAEFVGMVAAATGKRFEKSAEAASIVLPSIGSIVEQEQIGDALDALTADNVDLITNMGDEYLRKVQRAINDNFMTGKYIGKGGLEKELSRVSRVSKNRAKLIARDQTSKINASMVRIRATGAGSIGYQWNNVQDQRVRGNPNGKYPNVPKSRNHWNREGQYFLWSNSANPPIAPNGKPFRKPPIDGAPGEAINCRCFARPIFPDS